MFSIHTAPEKFENTTITGHFGLVAEEKSVGGNHIIFVISIKVISNYHSYFVFGKLRFQNIFLSTLKRKDIVFKFLRFEERF